MGSKYIDLTGQRYGRLTVKKLIGKNEQGKYIWLCKCDCGNEKIVKTEYLRSGHTMSCGCYHKELVGKINRKHNLIKKVEVYILYGKVSNTDVITKTQNLIVTMVDVGFSCAMIGKMILVHFTNGH